VIKLRAFISVDLEGMPYVVIPGHLGLKGAQYSEARKIATRLTLATAEELHGHGFEEVVVADSHGPMVNLLVEDLPDFVEIIRGYPRPLAMVAGIEGSDVALFLGYHAKSGTAYATFDHTYSGGTIQRLIINDIEVSEFLLNAYAAGESKVPVILVAGDYQLLEDDVKHHAPWAERIELKRSFGRGAARSYGIGRIETELRKGVKRAINNFKQKKMKPLRTQHPVKMQLTFKSSYFADSAELLPFVTRTGGNDVQYTAKNMIEGYKIFELMCLAAAGVTSIKSRQ
jgi:D-amino peptidase